MFYLFVILAFPVSVTMTVLKPVGAKLCRELCSKYGQCHYPMYVKNELACYLTETDNVSKRLGIPLMPPQTRDKEKPFYRLIMSRGKKWVSIKRTDFVGQQPRTLKTSKHEGYTTVQAGRRKKKVKLHMKWRSWERARNVCRSEGGDLLKIESKEISDAIGRFTYQTVRSKRLWMALRDANKTNMYMWTDGSPPDFSAWQEGEPSNEKRFDEDEDCAVMITDQHLWNLRTSWVDIVCSHSEYFVCEIPEQ